MERHRLRAPSTDGALLAVPPLAEAGGLLAANAERLDGWDHDFQGRRASRLRAAVRGQVLDRARAYLDAAGLDAPTPAEFDRLVVTGHQPELFHPGVWVKNFAAAAIARAVGGRALNIVVDNDIPKSGEVKVPRPENGAIRVERVPFGARGGEAPYEDLAVADEGTFAAFPDRARAALGGAVADPVLDEFWPLAMRFRSQTANVGARFALARRALEANWGVHNAEIPLSAFCETEGFLWFACHLLAHLPRYQAVHNDALGRYRAAHGIRSRHHPVPALDVQGDWREAPFWAWRAAEPRRRPLMARQLAKTIEIRIYGEDEVLAELPLGPDREACCAVERLAELPSRGVRLRTRALTTTMFARYLLGDLFLHGIGGAKYDELGDEISGRFFGFTPPGYLTMSMTLWLGLGDDPTAPGRLAALRREKRDLTYNPERFLDGAAAVDVEAADWVAAKRRAVLGPVDTHAQRLERFRAIRRCNEALQPWVAERRAAAAVEDARLAEAVRRNGLARGREYAFVLHSSRALRGAMGGL